LNYIIFTRVQQFTNFLHPKTPLVSSGYLRKTTTNVHFKFEFEFLSNDFWMHVQNYPLKPTFVKKKKETFGDNGKIFNSIIFHKIQTELVFIKISNLENFIFQQDPFLVTIFFIEIIFRKVILNKISYQSFFTNFYGKYISINLCQKYISTNSSQKLFWQTFIKNIFRQTSMKNIFQQDQCNRWLPYYFWQDSFWKLSFSIEIDFIENNTSTFWKFYLTEITGCYVGD